MLSKGSSFTTQIECFKTVVCSEANLDWYSIQEPLISVTHKQNTPEITDFGTELHKESTQNAQGVEQSGPAFAPLLQEPIFETDMLQRRTQ